MAFSHVQPNCFSRIKVPKQQSSSTELILIEQPWELCRIQEKLTDKTVLEHVKVEAKMKYLVPYRFFPYLRFLAQPIMLPCTCNHSYDIQKIERFIQTTVRPINFDFEGFWLEHHAPRPTVTNPLDTEETEVSIYTQDITRHMSRMR